MYVCMWVNKDSNVTHFQSRAQKKCASHFIHHFNAIRTITHLRTLLFSIVRLFFLFMCVCQRINKLRNGSTLPIHKNFTRRDISVVHTKSSLGLFSFVVVVVVVFRLRRIPFRQRN